jgi:16S rRNA (guanine966-N2)-methyltransferase
MLDRVRESLFSIISASIPDAHVLDLFSGCGALGLEALSRGAARCVFVERDPRLAELIQQNVVACRMSDRCDIVRIDFRFLQNRTPPRGFGPAALVLADPPYAMIDAPNERADFFKTLEALIGPWIRVGATIMLHHSPAPHMVWPTSKLECRDRRVYGNSQITIFESTRGDA